MTTTVVFDILTDDAGLQEAVKDIRHDPVETWRLAVFVAQMQLEKALKSRAVSDHYKSVQKRAKATRAARLAGAS